MFKLTFGNLIRKKLGTIITFLQKLKPDDFLFEKQFIFLNFCNILFNIHPLTYGLMNRM